MLNNDFQPLKKALKQLKIKKNLTAHLKDSISVKKKNNYYLYNYKRLIKVEPDHPIIMACRGLVVNNEGRILNYPFNRFFNHWDKKRTPKIKWSKALFQEKTDGSLINLWWNGEKWELTSRGSFYSREKPDEKFDEWFLEILPKHAFNELDENVCYMFELISEHNKIITNYDREMIVLLGARNLTSLKELNQKELDSLAENMGVERPIIFEFKSLKESLKFFNDCSKDFEGFVVVDEKFNRIKVKNPEYFKLSKLVALTEEKLFNYLFHDEHEELFKGVQTSYLPELVVRLERMRDDVEVFMRETENKFTSFGVTSRKEFAVKANEWYCSKLLFALFDGKDFLEELTFNDLMVFREMRKLKENQLNGCKNDME